MTFSLSPTRRSSLPVTAASMRTRAVSWNAAAARNEEVVKETLEIPRRSVSPTAGFLGKATTGPLADFYHNLAGSAWVDWVFMIALLFIGLALVFGICLHLASWGGVLLMVAMWSALWPVENNPLIDEHIIYALMLAGFGSTDVCDSWSLRARWKATVLVQRHPFLA